MIAMIVSKKVKGLFFVGVLGLLEVFGCISAHAQEAKTVFVTMPDSVCPLLTAVNRADCIDFLESKMKAKVQNRFGSESEMTDLSRDYIRIQMTPQSTWQMKLLALNDTTKVICTIWTACAPVCDSRIQFYTANWAKLPTFDFIAALPVLDDFFLAPDSAAAYTFANARLAVDMLLMKVDLVGDKETLTFALTTPEYMQTETADKLKPFICRPIVYTWKEEKFIPSDTH